MARPGERMSAVDAAWLRMDQPTNAMVITTLLTFDEAPAFSDLEAVVRERLLPLPRFRQKVVEARLGAPRWVDDPGFDLARHLVRRPLHGPDEDRELDEVVAELGSAPLDHDHPLWQVHVVERSRGGAVVVRVHHCVGDGVALIRLLLGISDQERAMQPQEVGLAPETPRGAVASARALVGQGIALGRMLALPADPPSALRGELGSRKRLVSSRPIPLDEIRAIRARHHVSVNDVLVTALTGAVRRYLEDHGGLPGRDVRAMVPVYLRGHASDGELGNHFGLVYLDLPVHEPDAPGRLRVARARMDAIKRAPDAVVALEVLGALGLARHELEELGIDLFTRKASVMFTNVAGPPGVVHLAGRSLTSIVVWAPVSGHLGLGFSALSYAGAIRVGVRADARCIADPDELLAGFDAELAELGQGAIRSTTSPALHAT